MTDTEPKVLITRPAAQGRAFTNALTERLGTDLPVILSPLIRIRFLEILPDLSRFAGVVITSRNAVAALARQAVSVDGQKAWCVGDRTAGAAQALGFETATASGDADDLIRLIRESDASGPLLHLRGREVRGDIARALRHAGCDVEEAILYHQDAMPLSPAALAALAAPAPLILPVFSPRTATLLASTADRVTAPLHLVAISGAVERALSPMTRRTMHVAPRPDQAAMVDCVARQYTACRLEAGSEDR